MQTKPNQVKFLKTQNTQNIISFILKIKKDKKQTIK